MNHLDILQIKNGFAQEFTNFVAIKFDLLFKIKTLFDSKF